jgi:N-glycosylase/DNA lyase
MKYKGYDVYQEEDVIVVSDVCDFDLVHTLECGQAFRWMKQQDGTYTGVVQDRVINVGKKGKDIFIKNTTMEDFKKIWFHYFDLGRDYSEIKEKIAKDQHMRAAIDYGHGMRILNQDFYETLISFIISGNNNFSRIMGIVDRLSILSQKKLKIEGEIYHAFPSPEVIVKEGMEGIVSSRMGYRAKYVYGTSITFLEEKICQNNFKKMDTESAKKELMKFSGVGSKVADCVLLFSHTKLDVFPVDVWVKRVMETLYLGKDVGLGYINEYAREYFGELCGFAQQYLFYYARANKIGK